MASPSDGLWLWFGAQVGAWGGGGVEAEAGGSSSPTYFPSPARWHIPSLTLRLVFVAPVVLG